MAAEPCKTSVADPTHVHWCGELPYRALVYMHDSPHGTPLYAVAGSGEPARKAVKALKAALKRHGGRCYYCPDDAQGVAAHLEVDHIEATSKGRNDLLRNLVISCNRCNGKKGALPIETFRPNAGRTWLLAAQSLIRARLQLLDQEEEG